MILANTDTYSCILDVTKIEKKISGKPKTLDEIMAMIGKGLYH
jgi:hypothetical protein